MSRRSMARLRRSPLKTGRSVESTSPPIRNEQWSSMCKGRCEYCQSRADYTTEPFAVEHIIPVSRGGSSELDNLAFSCSGCNGHKYNKMEAPDRTDRTLVPLYNPRRQRWQDHFVGVMTTRRLLA